MNPLAKSEHTIILLLNAYKQLEAALADAWPEISGQIQSKLDEISQLSAPEAIDPAVTAILFLLGRTSASPLIRDIMQQVDSQTATHSHAKNPFRSKPDTEPPTNTVTEAQLNNFQAGMRRAAAIWQRGGYPKTLSGHESTRSTAKSVEFEATSAERFINTGFFTSTGEQINADQPLTLNASPVTLRVNVGSFWGIGRADLPIPDHLLAPHYQDDELELLIAVSSPDVTLTSATQALHLPRHGDSPMVDFEVSLQQSSHQTLVVDLLFAGHLLQSRRVTFMVAQSMDDTPSSSVWPLQDAYTTFTRTASLDEEVLDTLAAQPRALTIVAEEEPTSGQIGLRFYDQTGESLNFELTQMSSATLTNGMVAIRKTLYDLMKAYAKNDGLDQVQLVAHLSKLANRGRSLYRQMLPGLTDKERQTESGQLLRAALTSGTIIQAAPLSARLSVPWELLYERPVNSYRAGKTKLCDTFQTHGSQPEDCPHHGDGHVICPHSFWGFRYIIEQLPGRMGATQQPIRHALPQWIWNEKRPFTLTGLVYPKFQYLQRHWRRLRNLAPASELQLHQLDSYDEIEQFFQGDEDPHLVYFYAHGGEHNGLAALTVADEMFITSGDLEAWGVKWEQQHPLLILNACKSADFKPDSFEDMIQAFFRRGAAGVIGTQCTIYEDLVDQIMPPFLASFMGQTSVGQALYDARRQLMWQHKDPRGLTYSLFAAAELKLAQRVGE